MRHTDILIVGGGLAGSLAAAMLGRRGIPGLVVDPHGTYPPELRCEKLDAGQIAILERTGLAGTVLPASMPAEELWVVRMDRLVDKKPGLQRGVRYDDMVNRLRGAIAGPAELVRGKVAAIEPSAERQLIRLASGEEISARLVVVANGLNLSLRESLGLVRRVLSPTHSVTVGFDVRPAGGGPFRFPALTYYAARPADRWAYLTLFPVPGAMRANLIVYRDMTDPWLARVRRTPREAMLELMPRLEEIAGPIDVAGEVWVRPADLYQTEDVHRPGIVLAGDAFATSCPGAGTGTGKVFTDVERLCNRYIPEWLATPGMAAGKIAAFYADPEKQAYDAFSRAAAFGLKSASTSRSPRWAAIRWGKFASRAFLGHVRQARAALRRPAVQVPASIQPGH